jgi:hypothetical protein
MAGDNGPVWEKRVGWGNGLAGANVLWRAPWAIGALLGNSGKSVTLETLSLTKFSKYVFQEQGIRESRKCGTYEVSNSRMC